MIEAKKKYKGLKHEVSKEREAEVREDMEYLEEVDKSTGKEFVQDWEKNKTREENRSKENWKDTVKMSKGSSRYKEKLCEYGNSKVPDLDFDGSWSAQFFPTNKRSYIRIEGKPFNTEDGVILALKSPGGEVFIRAIRLYYEPDIDFAGVDTLLVQAENTYDSYRGALNEDPDNNPNDTYQKNSSGIYIPKK